jgi:DNA-binding transcriptional LysR family regulator
MRDLRFEDMHLFVRVADLGSLSAVARERDVPVSQVSRTLTRIEKASGARLIHRSTHGLTPTAEGQTFLDYCRRITSTLDDLEGEFAGHSGQPSGWVRVAASTVVAEHLLIPSFESLQQQHPLLRVELLVDDRMADMARDGIDIAIRTGPPLTDTVVARPLGTLARGLYATPAYLQAHGRPQHPDDLHQHRLITNSAVALLNHWPFLIDGVPHTVVADGHWRSGNTATTARLALQGLGIARLATLVGVPLVRQGLLEPVLAPWVDPQPGPIHAITLTRRHRLPKIQACIDHWAQWFARHAQ